MNASKVLIQQALSKNVNIFKLEIYVLWLFFTRIVSLCQISSLNRKEISLPVKVYNFEVKDWHTYFVSNLNILVHNQGCGFTHSLYLEIFHALGEIGVKKFSNALQKGISGGGEGDTGIKKLDGKGKYGCMSEIKIQGKKGVRNARVYGNLVDGEYEWEVYKDSH